MAVAEAEEVAGGLCFPEALDHTRSNVPLEAATRVLRPLLGFDLVFSSSKISQVAFLARQSFYLPLLGQVSFTLRNCCIKDVVFAICTDYGH